MTSLSKNMSLPPSLCDRTIPALLYLWRAGRLTPSILQTKAAVTGFSIVDFSFAMIVKFYSGESI